MKRMLICFVLILLCLFSCACGEKEKSSKENKNENNSEITKNESSNIANMVNPMTEYDSLDEINKIADSKLISPVTVSVNDEKFFVYKGYDQPLAEYRFTMNGYEFSFRCCAVGKTDISGLYVGGKSVFPNEPKEDLETFFGDQFKAARWFTLDGQYVLSVIDDKEFDEKTFLSICTELKEMTFVSNY